MLVITSGDDNTEVLKEYFVTKIISSVNEISCLKNNKQKGNS